MAKRFIDTGLFDDEWFSELSVNSKLFWIYYLTKCDHAGLLKFNKKLIEFQTGINSLDTVIKELGDRIVRVNEQLFFLPKFIKFQYPDFPKSKVRAQASAIELLIKNGLWDSETNNFKELDNSYQTVTKEFNNSYGNDNGNGYGSVEINKEPEVEFWPTFEDFWDKYDKKVGKPKCIDLWGKVKQPDRELIMQHLDTYQMKDKQYRLDPERYLKRRTWNDEVILTNNGHTKTNRKESPEDLARAFAERVVLRSNGEELQSGW